MRSVSAILLLAAVLSAGTGSPAGAQKPRSMIRGTVVTTKDLTPIPGVSVALVGTGRVVRTDKEGAFVFDSLFAGTYLVQVRGSGDETPMTPVPLGAKEIIDLEVKLGKADAVMLPELVANAPEPAHAKSDFLASRLPAEFVTRQKIGVGSFITRDQIQARNPPTVVDIFRGVRGFMVNCRGSLCLPRSIRAGCAPIVVVDRMSTDAGVLLAMSPNDIEALEIYNGVSEVPSEYLRPRDRPQCGLIVVWSRVPPGKKGSSGS